MDVHRNGTFKQFRDCLHMYGYKCVLKNIDDSTTLGSYGKSSENLDAI